MCLIYVVGVVQEFGKVRKQQDGKMLVKCLSKSGNPTSQNAVRVGVLGASGYTGSEVISCMAHNGSKCVERVEHGKLVRGSSKSDF